MNLGTVWGKELDRMRSSRRRTMMVLICVGLILELFFLHIVYSSKMQEQKRAAQSYGQIVAASIRLSLDKTINMTEMIRNQYEDRGDAFLENFDQAAQNIMKAEPTVASVYYAPDGVIAYAYPKEYEAATIGFDMLNDPDQGERARLALETKQITVAGPHALVEGGIGFIIRNPIFVDDEFSGFVIIILDWEAFVKQTIETLSDRGANYHFAVWKDNDAYAVEDEYGYIMRSCDHAVERTIDIPIQVPNDVWHLTVEPVDGYNLFKDLWFETLTSVLLFLIIILSIYLKIRSSEKMLQAAEYDDLTGLYTKHAFYRHVGEFIEAHPDRQFDVVVCDVENFKFVNSIYGEQAGDDLLRYIAKAIYEFVGEGVCTRFSGDKFVTFSLRDVNRTPETLIEFNERLTANAPIKNLVVKYGVYQDADTSVSVQLMCDRALVALKSIKHNYDKVFANFDGPVSKQVLKSRMFETNFEDALKNKEFKVWYQPKFDAHTEQLVGAEALVRWIKQDGTIVSPGEFIPVFEEDGLIVKLDEFVFRDVCRHMKEWKEKGLPMIPVSVNLSRASLRHEGLVERYRAIVEEMGISVECVPIELTESASFRSNQIKDLTNELKDQGFQLYMDDFGAGFSSLSSLNTLPFDLVKLDKSLIDYIGDIGGKEIIRHIIELAHFKKMQVVAEGVEHKEQLDSLRQLDCDTIQGYYYSAPKPYEEFIKYLNNDSESK